MTVDRSGESRLALDAEIGHQRGFEVVALAGEHSSPGGGDRLKHTEHRHSPFAERIDP